MSRPDSPNIVLSLYVETALDSYFCICSYSAPIQICFLMVLSDLSTTLSLKLVNMMNELLYSSAVTQL